MIITKNGDAFVFGSNRYGELGIGHTQNVLRPTLIKSPSEKKLKN